MHLFTSSVDQDVEMPSDYFSEISRILQFHQEHHKRKTRVIFQWEKYQNAINIQYDNPYKPYKKNHLLKILQNIFFVTKVLELFLHHSTVFF